jgi:hypothetical protein
MDLFGIGCGLFDFLKPLANNKCLCLRGKRGVVVVDCKGQLRKLKGMACPLISFRSLHKFTGGFREAGPDGPF